MLIVCTADLVKINVPVCLPWTAIRDAGRRDPGQAYALTSALISARRKDGAARSVQFGWSCQAL